MVQIWQIMKRDLWPRLYTAWFVGMGCGAFVCFMAIHYIRSQRPVDGYGLILSAFLGWTAVRSLIEAVVLTRRAMIRRRYERWTAEGLCGHCGYDLRAATSPTCPECGGHHGRGGKRKTLDAPIAATTETGGGGEGV